MFWSCSRPRRHVHSSCKQAGEQTMLNHEQLSYGIDRSAENDLSIDLTLTTELSTACMVIDAAATSYPSRMITRRGPGLCDMKLADTSDGLRPVQVTLRLALHFQ